VHSVVVVGNNHGRHGGNRRTLSHRNASAMNIKISTGIYVNRVFTPFEGEQVWYGTLDEYVQELLEIYPPHEDDEAGDIGISLTEDELRSSLEQTGIAEFCGSGHAAYMAEVV
jgi:hypothetical protein